MRNHDRSCIYGMLTTTDVTFRPSESFHAQCAPMILRFVMLGRSAPNSANSFGVFMTFLVALKPNFREIIAREHDRRVIIGEKIARLQQRLFRDGRAVKEGAFKNELKSIDKRFSSNDESKGFRFK